MIQRPLAAKPTRRPPLPPQPAGLEWPTESWPTGPVGEHTSARLSVMRQSRGDWVDNVNNGSGDDLEG